MIQISPHMRILVAVKPEDFRRGIDGLANVCKQQLGSDPFCGTIFVFKNRRSTAIKILTYDGRGFWLMQKRLSSGKFCYWPRSEDAGKTLEAHELHVLLAGGDPESAQALPKWRQIKVITG